MRQLINIKVVARNLNLSRASVYRLMNEERLPHIHLGGRLLFDPAEMDKYIEDHKVEEKPNS